MGQCKICGTDLNKDLFAYVTQKPVCCICTAKFVGGDFSDRRIAYVRALFGLAPGEYLVQDQGVEAEKILRKIQAEMGR
jgi:hypothetical protein